MSDKDRWEEFFAAQCRAKDVEIEFLKTALRALKGYMMNAEIDLRTNTKKSTTLGTIAGGIRIADEALSR